MGCDGGSIPRRAEMVKTKCKNESIDDTESVKTQWTCCFISKKPLERPVVACKLGRLYNKESVVMYLLSKDEVDPALAHELSHLKSLKGSLINCNLKEIEGASSDYFVCPITGREMNGKSRFYISRTCGCVISEQAVNQFPDSKTCLLCERAIGDLIPLYPKGEELEKLKAALTEEKPRKRPLSTSKQASVPENLLKEVKASGSEIGTLKRTKVTDSLYIKK